MEKENVIMPLVLMHISKSRNWITLETMHTSFSLQAKVPLHETVVLFPFIYNPWSLS